MTIPELEAKAEYIRKDLVRVAMKNDCGHIASSLSCTDILVALYYEVMEEDDVCIVSKGHGAYAQLAILADKKHIDRRRWEAFDFTGCLERQTASGILTSTGALGNGVAAATGLALGRYLQQQPGHVFCIAGDGEMEEGICHEAWELAHELIGYWQVPPIYTLPLTYVVDRNRFRALGRSRLPGFLNEEGQKINGHGMHDLVRFLSLRPLCIKAMTTKGRRIQFMEQAYSEGDGKWHYRVPSLPNELSWIESWLTSDGIPKASSCSSTAAGPSQTKSNESSPNAS